MLVPMLFVFILLKSVETENVEGHCVLRGICGKDPTVTVGKIPKLLCVDEGPPTEMDASLKKLMKKACPHFESEISSNICCTKEQIRDLKSQFKSLDLIASHCPTCTYNMKKVFCDFTCHPEQSKFLNVSVKIWGPNDKGEEVEMAKVLQYYANIDFVNSVYNGCKDVLFPSQSISIMGFICGTAPTLCTPKKLLNYMGTPSSITSPFKIDFKYSDDPPEIPHKFEYYSPNTLTCDVPPPGESVPCSCTNCELSCSQIDFGKYQTSSFIFYIGGIDGLSIVMGVIFSVFTVAFLFVLVQQKNQGNQITAL